MKEFDINIACNGEYLKEKKVWSGVVQGCGEGRRGGMLDETLWLNGQESRERKKCYIPEDPRPSE